MENPPMNKIEEKAKEYADFHWLDDDGSLSADFDTEHELCKRDFKAGFEAGQQESKWISVKEELPKVDEVVQVWNIKWGIAKLRKVGDTLLWHYDGSSRYSYDYPTHWQPLPSPPNQISDDSKEI